jgi:FtsH-binding integral membrane protein
MITLTIMIDHIITMVGIITTVGIIVVDTTTIITADIEEETTIMVDTDTITDVVIAQK